MSGVERLLMQQHFDFAQCDNKKQQMKILLVIIFISFFTQIDWVKYIEKRVELINRESKEVLNKTKSDNKASLNHIERKLNSQRKIIFTLESEGDYSLSYNYEIYKEEEFIFATKFNCLEHVFYKGVSKNKSVAKIKETNNYFKNDSVGISYSRKIDVFANQSIDSLKIELQKKDFIESHLNKDDYKQECSKYKRLQKQF